MAQQLPFPTINVIPAGFRWTREAAGKAALKSAFLRVGGAQVSRRFLSGAKRSWTSAKPEENQTIFHTGFRITGTPEAVRQALIYAGENAESINQVLATSITSQNFQTSMAQAYNQEIQAHALLKGKKPVAPGYEWNQILWFAKELKTAVIATKTGEAKGNVASPGRVGTGETLADKVKKVPQGKVVDVSNMDINTGKGHRTLPAPKTAKGGKYGTARIPIISNDINKYIRALELVYGPDAPQVYAADIQVVRDAINKHGIGALNIQPNIGLPMNKVPTPTRVQANIVPTIRTPTKTFGGATFPPMPQLKTF